MRKLTKNILRSGFTLIEVIIVLAIIGIVAMFSIPNIIDALPDYRLRSSARDVISFLQEAKLLAIKENTAVKMNFDAANRQYSMWIDVDNNTTYDPGSGEALSNQDNLLLGVDFFQTPNIGFNGKGMPSSGADTIIINNNKSNYRHITVNISGNIRVTKSSDGINDS